MKLLVSLFVITLVTLLAYRLASKVTNRQVKEHKKVVAFTILVLIFLFSLLALIMRQDTQSLDSQCSMQHKVAYVPPQNPKTGMDYFTQGNYDYDIGNCPQAITDYTTSINLNPTYPQALNNRAYTYMRLRKFEPALNDLDLALELNPNYVHALINRGDIYNYYYKIDRQKAISDYQRVIALGKTEGTSVCGHLFLAKHNGWNLGTVLNLPWAFLTCR
jgi:tetratricopeptide (TPR) repeat protein